MYRIRSFDRTPKRLLKGTLRFRRFTPHPHLTRDKRKIARLAIFPNFLRYATKTSFIPDVI